MRLVVALSVALITAGCAPAALPTLVRNPADPTHAVPPVRHSSALASYRSQRPIDPHPWREQNEGVAPDAKQ